MSFYVNNGSLNTITFNDKDVKSVYYNNNLVWEKEFNWDVASWDDIHWAINNGQMDKIPLGATKTVNLTSIFSGNSSIDFMVVHKTSDSVIFHAKDCFVNPTVFRSSANPHSTAYADSAVYKLCENLYSYMPTEVRSHLHTFNRNVVVYYYQHWDEYNWGSGYIGDGLEVYDMTQTIFLPTCYELTGKNRMRGYFSRYQEYNDEGFDYQFDYYKNGGSLEKANAGNNSLDYWTCSTDDNDIDYCFAYTANGYTSSVEYAKGFAPAFVFK